MTTRFFVLALACLGIAGCALPARPLIEARVASTATPWTGLEALDAPEDFHFIVVTDRTGEHRDGIFESAMPVVNGLRPAFVVSVGDLIEGYSDDEAELDAQWDEIQRFVDVLQMPFFYAAGNHDMSNAVMSEKWRERFGPTFYHFRYKGALFLVLNSELFSMVSQPGQSLAGPETQAEQMAFVERVLEENDDARWALVFIHQPLWDSPRVHPDWLRVEERLGRRPYTVFAGHIHRYTQHIRNDRRYLTLATTGGMSELRGPLHGEFDHVAWVSMTEAGPVIANVLLDGVLPEDVRDEALRARVEALEKVVRMRASDFSGDRFRGGTLRLELHNPDARELEVVGRFPPGPHFSVSPAELRERLAPGATHEVTLSLNAHSPVAFEVLAASQAHWTLRAAGEPEPLELSFTRPLQPERAFSIPRLEAAVAIDGRLDEWGPLPLEVLSPAQVDHREFYAGPEDGSMRFAIRQDDQALYLAVAVRDDALESTADDVARNQDSVMISIDARPEPARSAVMDSERALVEGEMRNLIFLPLTPGVSKPDPVLATFMSPLPEGTRSAAVQTPDGYSLELAIPNAALDEKRGGRWDALRLDLSVADFDPGDAGHSVLWWRPSRYGPASVPGSGTFLRD